MRFEFHDSKQKVGSAQWEGPGQVNLNVDDDAERDFLSTYFASEMTYMATPFDEDEDALQVRRRDWTPWEFERACLALASKRGYRVHMTPSEAVEARPAAS
ncbi:MAG: hypothetical protein LC722_04660 [Actinobacteria bacterium]|nr:hypothetical protein [Actinomycetota bacterium]